MNLQEIQKAIADAGFDGWLFYDFHGRDAISTRILKIDDRFRTRRWYYFIPAHGTPQKLTHAIEPWSLDHLEGDRRVYLPWQQQHQMLKEMLGSAKKVAMQYSPNNAIPYVSVVDGGTIELVRSLGFEVVSSADLVSIFESHLTETDRLSHVEASEVMQYVKDETFKEIGRRIKNGEHPKECEIQAFMHVIMRKKEMFWEDGPISSVNVHNADPHFDPTPANSLEMKMGDLVLLDLWAKKKKPGSIYADITWMGYIGDEVPSKFEDVFQIAAKARDAACEYVKDKFAKKELVRGCDVDDACRKVIIDAGYGEYFIHRTGHNIAEEVHGNGTHIDNLETKDERYIIKGSCFSIEPGIYMPKKSIGVRTEIDVFITEDGQAVVYGDVQKSVVPIMKLQ